MIKVILMLRRQPRLSREEFLAYWSGPHRALAVQAAGAIRMRRYVQNHPVQHPLAEALRASRGALAADYDGMVEAWWDSLEDLATLGDTAGDIAGALLEDERRFVDLERSEIWCAEEHVCVDAGAAATG